MYDIIAFMWQWTQKLSTPSLITLRIAKLVPVVGLEFTSFQHLHNTLILNMLSFSNSTLCSKKNITREKDRKEGKQYKHILKVRTSMGYKLFFPNTLRVISAEGRDKFKSVINLGHF